MSSLFRATKNVNGKKKTYPGYYGRYKNEFGSWAKTPKLSNDRAAAQQMLNEIQRDADKRRAGIVTPLMDQAARPVAEHVKDYMDDLKRQHLDAMHLRITENTMTRLAELGQWRRLSDITADNVATILARLSEKGLSVATVNRFLMRAKAFVHWLLDRHRIATDTLHKLKKTDERGKRKRARRALTDDEVARLLKLTPAHRADVYRFALLTGLRRKELHGLRWDDLHIDGDEPYVQLREEQTKNGEADALPLHPDLVVMLKGFHRGMAGARVFWAVPEVRTLQRDLKRASIPFVDAVGRRADFHALRHTYCTMLARQVPNMKSAQELMRHSDPRLTANVYSHLGRRDIAKALASLKLPTDDSEANAVKATGTDGKSAENGRTHVGQTCSANLRLTASSGADNQPRHAPDAGAAAIILALQSQASGVVRRDGASLCLLTPETVDSLTQTGPRSSVG